MKTKIYSIVAGLLLTVSVFAQAPQKMSYQAVIRNSSSALITSTPVGVKISILQGTPTGTVAYSEIQTVSTNANGLVSLEIGTGTVITGTFAAINWANGPYFIKTETDPTGGTAYSITGTNELLSVPYALHAKTADNAVSTTIPTYTIGLWPELGGYVFRISADGRHGLVAETQNQSASTTWYIAQDIISAPANHSANGQKFMDWRLPTRYELNEMYTQRVAIGGFASSVYWSSTEEDTDFALNQNFLIGFQYNANKSSTGYVRAVRAF